MNRPHDRDAICLYLRTVMQARQARATRVLKRVRVIKPSRDWFVIIIDECKVI
jgi:hypothetical protein